MGILRNHSYFEPGTNLARKEPTTAMAESISRKKFGSIRKLPSGRFQVRYSVDGTTYTARTEDGRALTFVTKTDAKPG